MASSVRHSRIRRFVGSRRVLRGLRRTARQTRAIGRQADTAHLFRRRSSTIRPTEFSDGMACGSRRARSVSTSGSCSSGCSSDSFRSGFPIIGVCVPRPRLEAPTLWHAPAHASEPVCSCCHPCCVWRQSISRASRRRGPRRRRATRPSQRRPRQLRRRRRPQQADVQG